MGAIEIGNNQAPANLSFIRMDLKNEQTMLIVERDNESKWVKRPISGIEGVLRKIEEYTFISKEDQQEYPGFRLYLEDAGHFYVLETSWTRPATSIMNTLAGDNGELGRLSIKLYFVDGYPRASVYNNGGKTNWKFSIDEQRAMTKEVKFKGKTMKDNSELITALQNEIPLINATLGDMSDVPEVKDRGSSQKKDADELF